VANVEFLSGGHPATRHRAFTRERLIFGYSLLAPAIVYMVLLVGIPFFFSLYLALSDASVGNQVARYVGLSNFVAIFQDSTFRQALRNTMRSVVTVLGVQRGMRFAGAVMTEIVFAGPGSGRIVFTGILAHDYPVVVGFFLCGGTGGGSRGAGLTTPRGGCRPPEPVAR